MATLFAPNDATLRSTLPVPGALMCPHYGDEAKHRPYLTLLGVAGRLGVRPHHSQAPQQLLAGDRPTVI